MAICRDRDFSRKGKVARYETLTRGLWLQRRREDAIYCFVFFQEPRPVEAPPVVGQSAIGLLQNHHELSGPLSA